MFLTKKCRLFITILFSSFLLPEVEKIFFNKFFLGKICLFARFYFLNSTKKMLSLQKNIRKIEFKKL